MKKISIAAIAALLLTAGVHAQAGRGQELSDLETDIMIESKRLQLLKARADVAAFRGTGSSGTPLILSVYGSGPRARALLDLGPAGVREVRIGDLLGDDMVVNAIDADRGVEVRVGRGKGAGALFLNMKAAPAATQTQQGNVPPAPGYPIAQPGIVVPPIAPAPPLMPAPQPAPAR